MKKLCILLTSIFLLTACGNENGEQVQMPDGEEMRIISLMPSNTEIVAELGKRTVLSLLQHSTIILKTSAKT